MEKDKYTLKLQDRHLYFVHKESCFHLTSDGKTVQNFQEDNLFASQEEADSRMMLHVIHIAQCTRESTVIIICSPDTDVFLLLLKFFQNVDQSVLFDTGVSKKKKTY